MALKSNKMQVLLVEPNFPNFNKSKFRKNSLPIGLLKLASFYRAQGNEVRLVVENQTVETNFDPELILITSSFTYWFKYVWDSVAYYKKMFPNAKIIVGGIYASLMPEHCKQSGCDEVNVGVYAEAEKYSPAYDLLEPRVKYQIIHTSRGCLRKCAYCGVWKIEPKFICKDSIKNEIITNSIIFYDNNLLANPYISNILKELIDIRKQKPSFHCESQCGIDARLLTEEISLLLKKAGFKNMRIAWDWNFGDWKKIQDSIEMLCSAGFRRKDLYVFMIYNWEIPFDEMEKKRIKCWNWQVQIADCRFRRIDQTIDNYKPLKKQSANDYFIHPKWSDNLIKEFRRRVRRQNICVRHGFPFYSKSLETKRVTKDQRTKLSTMARSEVKQIVDDAWFPEEKYKF